MTLALQGERQRDGDPGDDGSETEVVGDDECLAEIALRRLEIATLATRPSAPTVARRIARNGSR